VLPQAGAAVQGQAGQDRRHLRPQAAGGAGRAVRRDHHRHAVRLPGLEHAHPGQVARPAVRHRLRGVRARRDAGGDDRAAAREGPERGHAGHGRLRPGDGCGDRWHGRAARHRGGRRRAPRRQQRQPLAGQLHHRQRQPAGRLPRQRQRRDAGPAAGRPALPHDRRQGCPRPAELPHRPRHHAPEPVAGGHRRAAGRGPGAAAGAEQLPAEAGELRGALPVPELLRRQGGVRGALGVRSDPGRQRRVHLPRRPDDVGADAAAHPARPPALRHRPEAEPGREGHLDGEGRPRQV
ncbi:MAG: Manganese catalase, partial [uncultured Friedmanniella sp.]